MHNHNHNHNHIDDHSSHNHAHCKHNHGQPEATVVVDQDIKQSSLTLNEAFKRDERYSNLLELMRHKVVLMDGGMGTCLQTQDLTAEDFGGVDLEGCNENLVVTRPELIQSIHEQYFQAGADIVETNTFGSTPLVLAEYGLQDKALDISRIAAEVARRAADNMSTIDRPRFVAGSIGPTTKAISVTGGVSFKELVNSYQVQIKGLLLGGIDIILIETTQDTINLRAALEGAHLAMLETGILGQE